MTPTDEERRQFIEAAWASMLFTGGLYSDTPMGSVLYYPGNVPAWQDKLYAEDAKEFEEDCDGFLGGDGVVEAIRADLGFSQAGHDFHLTRNGHGCGFWDGDWKEPGADLLTKWADTFGSFELDRGEDGKAAIESEDDRFWVTH